MANLVDSDPGSLTNGTLSVVSRGAGLALELESCDRNQDRFIGVGSLKPPHDTNCDYERAEAGRPYLHGRIWCLSLSLRDGSYKLLLAGPFGYADCLESLATFRFRSAIAGVSSP